MNIFFLDYTPLEIARALVDRHIVKMPVESAQMLSTAHRVLDGQDYMQSAVHPTSNRIVKKNLYLLEGETAYFNRKLDEDGNWICKWAILDAKCYRVAHARHPSTVWTMENSANYQWHFELMRAMLNEYTARYVKVHGVNKLVEFLSQTPKNIPQEIIRTRPPLAMPDKYKQTNVVDAYRSYYVGEKWKFANWKHGVMPKWFPHYMKHTWSASDSDREELLESFASKNKLPIDQRVYEFGKALTHDQHLLEVA